MKTPRRILTCSAARRDLFRIAAQFRDGSTEPVMLTLDNRPAAVLVSVSEFLVADGNTDHSTEVSS